MLSNNGSRHKCVCGCLLTANKAWFLFVLSFNIHFYWCNLLIHVVSLWEKTLHFLKLEKEKECCQIQGIHPNDTARKSYVITVR